MSDGYLSKDREHLAELQRKRRKRMTRIDYMPAADALAAIDAKRLRCRPGSVEATNSAIIDAIVNEWAELTKTKRGEVRKPKSPVKQSQLCDQYARARMRPDADHPARAQEPDNLPGINRHIASARVRAYESDGLARHLAQQEHRQAIQRVTCGARRHRDGQPCRAKSEPGKRRCRFHGGRSTGPCTAAGKARALANLRQNQNSERKKEEA